MCLSPVKKAESLDLSCMAVRKTRDIAQRDTSRRWDSISVSELEHELYVLGHDEKTSGEWPGNTYVDTTLVHCLAVQIPRSGPGMESPCDSDQSHGKGCLKFEHRTPTKT